VSLQLIYKQSQTAGITQEISEIGAGAAAVYPRRGGLVPAHRLATRRDCPYGQAK